MRSRSRASRSCGFSSFSSKGKRPLDSPDRFEPARWSRRPWRGSGRRPSIRACAFSRGCRTASARSKAIEALTLDGRMVRSRSAAPELAAFLGGHGANLRESGGFATSVPEPPLPSGVCVCQLRRLRVMRGQGRQESRPRRGAGAWCGVLLLAASRAARDGAHVVRLDQVVRERSSAALSCALTSALGPDHSVSGPRLAAGRSRARSNASATATARTPRASRSGATPGRARSSGSTAAPSSTRRERSRHGCSASRLRGA